MFGELEGTCLVKWIDMIGDSRINNDLSSKDTTSFHSTKYSTS